MFRLNSQKPKTWKEWFVTNSSNDIIDVGNKGKLFEEFNQGIDARECKRRLIEHDESLFLFKQNFGSRINTFHHLSKIGGNFYNQTEIFGAIQGIDQDATSIITPDIDTLISIPSTKEEKVPKLEHILAAKTRNDINNLRVSDDVKYSPRNFIPIPPFLFETVNDSIMLTEGSIIAVLIHVIEGINKFDDDSEDDGENEELSDETAKSSCGPLVFWLYLAYRSKIYAVSTIGCQNRTLNQKFRTLESMELSKEITANNQAQPTPINENLNVLKTPMEVIAANSASTQDALVKLTEMHKKSSDSTTKSFKKVAPQYQHMMLVASSQGNVVPSDINDDAKKFFAAPDRVQAQLTLNTLLDQQGIECSISTALSNLFSYGNLIWSSTTTPSGLASMVITSKDIFANETLLEGMVLDLSTKHEISRQDINKLTKTQVLLPTDIDTMLERFCATFAIAKLFFGENSILVTNLETFTKDCYKKKLLLKTMFHMDEEFIAKLMFSVDDRINKWLHECLAATTIRDTTIELVTFSDILTDIKLNKFNIFLPGNIKKLSKRSAPNELNENRNKKNKLDNQVRNDDQVADWKMQPKESWNKTFKGKIKNGPMLSCGTYPCLKYHVKGICYDDCAFKKSHIRLVGDDEKKADTFIKKLRSEN